MDTTQPLRLAKGNHRAGSGQGCAMNVISWENGDSTITDYPSCSARPLAALVQRINDTICCHTRDHMLCPDCSQVVLDLGHRTVGTGRYTRDQLRLWLNELRDNPVWGYRQYADDAFATNTNTTADAYAAAANTADIAASAASAADAAYAMHVADAVHAANAAYAAAYVANAAANANADADAAAYAAAAEATNTADIAASAAYAMHVADAVHAAHAAYAAAYVANAAANADAAAYARIRHARHAIDAWHRICGTSPRPISEETTLHAIRQMQEVR